MKARKLLCAALTLAMLLGMLPVSAAELPPEPAAPEKVLFVDFEGSDASDASGKGNTGTVAGSPVFEDSYDGSKALYLSNAFGPSAAQYVKFEALKGVDLTTDSYTLSVWVRTENSGATAWVGIDHRVTANLPLDMARDDIKSGGVLFSNTDATNKADGFTAAQLNQKQHLTVAAVADGDAAAYKTENIWDIQDARWHQLTVTVDRSGSYTIYVDGVSKGVKDISALTGKALGQNVLALGADALGQYGMGTVWFDDLALYAGVLDAAAVKASYDEGALKATIYEVETRVAAAGDEYPAPAVEAITAKLTEAKAATGDPAEAEAALRTAFEEFLLSSVDNAKAAFLLTSDLHIKTNATTQSDRLAQVFTDMKASGLPIDGMITSGDFADNGAAASLDHAFEIINDLQKDLPDFQSFFCLGNHEVKWNNADQNYAASLPRYLENLKAHISADSGERKYGTAVLDGQHNQCYAMTLKGYHFLSISTDYREQTGNAVQRDPVTNISPFVTDVDPINRGVVFDEDTRTWLQAQMEEYNKDGQPIFVLCHYPFEDSCPLSDWTLDNIEKCNTPGAEDQWLRNLLSTGSNVVYFCGHLHNSMGVSGPVTVEGASGTFTELNLPSFGSTARGYLTMPATWYMFIYENEIVLRGRDFASGKWLTAYDAVIPLNEVTLPLDTVYVSAAGADANTGASADQAVATLAAAYNKLPAAGGTVVVCGEYAPGTFDIPADAAAYNGTVTITGDDGKGQTGGKILFNGTAANIYNAFGAKTVLDDITLSAEGANTILFLSNESLTWGSKLKTDSTKVFAVYGGFKDASDPSYLDKDITITLNAGDVKMFQACRPSNVGNVTMNIGGTANITSTTQLGGQNSAKNVTLNVTGGFAGKTISIGPNAAGKTTDNVTVNLTGGRLGTSGKAIDACTKGNVTGDVSITIAPDMAFETGSTYGPAHKLIAGTVTLTLPGWTKALPDAMLANYDVVNITGNSDTSYTGELNGKALNVEAGSTIYLDAYESAEDAAAKGVTVSGAGTVTYKAPVIVDPDALEVAYVKDGGDDANDGTAPDKALATLDAAYGKLDAAKGGTVVVCGDLTVAAPPSVTSTGEVTITGSYEGTDYQSSLIFANTADMTILLGERTVIDHLDMKCTGTAKVTIYSGASITIGSDFTTDEVNKDKNYRIFGGNPNKTYTEDIAITIHAGTFQTIFCGTDSTGGVANVTCTVDGTARIESNIRGGGNKTDAGDVKIIVNSPDCVVNAIYPVGGGTTKSLTVQLLRGSFVSGKGILTATGTIAGDMAVELHPEFDLQGTAYGVGRSSKLVINGKLILTLPGWQGELPTTMAEVYDTLHITGRSEVTYKGLLDGKTVTVDAGSALRLEAYADAAAAAAAGVTVTGSGIVLYGPEGAVTYLDTVYLSGTVASSGDGTAPDKAVKTFAEAYDKLDKLAGGTIVLCGDYTLTESVETDHRGLITITGSYGGTDYAPTLTIDNAKGRNLIFGERTVMDHIDIVGTGTAGVAIYTRQSFTMGEGITTDIPNSYNFRGGHPSINYGDTDISLTLLGGKYQQVLLTQTNTSVGNVTYRHGGTAYINSNVTLGGQNGAIGDLDFTMTGGYIKVIYDTPRYSGTAGDVVMRLEGGSILEFRDYNKLSSGAATMGNITVYLGPDFTYSGAIGAWTDGYLTTGTKTLVVTDYAGATPPSLGCYDVVNFVGSHTVPDGFELTPAVTAQDHLLQIAAYRGNMTMALDSFTALNVAKDSDVMYLGSYPAGLPLRVEAGSAFRLSSITNTSLPAYTGEGTVELVVPQWSAPEKVLSVNFDGENAADLSGKGNTGAVTGAVTYDDSYNGSKAIFLNNTYGPQAQQYVLFDDLKGVDLTTGNYTVSFWIRMENGGADRWYGSTAAATPGSGVHMQSNAIGGIVLSNTDTGAGTASGFAAAQLHQTQFLTLAMTDTDGAQKATDGIRETAESLWHQLTITVDRAGYYKLYIDGALKSAVQISSLQGQALGENALALGADVLGQYGIGTAWIDDLTVYAGALDLVDVQAGYYLSRLQGTIYETERRIATAGDEYPAPAVQAATEALAQTKTAAAGLTEAEYAQAIPLERTLRQALLTFLDSSVENANAAWMLISDIHIGNATDARANNLRQLFADRAAAGIEIDGIIQAGDFADNSSPATSHAAFDVMDEVLSENPQWQLVGATGNHEQQYTDAGANYMASNAVYLARMQRHVAKEPEVRKQGTATLDVVHRYLHIDEDGNRFLGASCFGMTLNGYHYVVLNTDNPGQYADGSKVDQNDEAASNAADPIRHGVWFSDETLEWIDQTMSDYAQDGKPIFVVCHFPFTDTVPLSTFSPIPIKDNSIGKQDAQIRSILAKYDMVYYFCGHLHNAMGTNNVVTVTAENGDTFTEINLPTLKTSVRGYTPIPATWYMFVYDNEIVLRGRDAVNGKWVTEYDMILPLNGALSGAVAITGEATEGETLVADLSGLTPVSAEVALTWSRGETVVGTGSSYTLTEEDVGYAITLTVTGTGLYSGTLTAQSGIVAADYDPPYSSGGTTTPTEPGEDKPDEPKPPIGGFVDIEDNWAVEDIRYVVENGLMDGVDATHFAPGEEMTRGMAVTVLYRLAGEPEVIGKADWVDVEAGAWFTDAITWATRRGIVNGVDAQRFAPDDVMTREQMAALFYRYYLAMDLKPSGSADLSGYADLDQISAYALTAFRWAVEEGIINGTSATTLSPRETVTREQLAALLARISR